jgi:2-methylcitrate dehydratase PrpD
LQARRERPEEQGRRQAGAAGSGSPVYRARLVKGKYMNTDEQCASAQLAQWVCGLGPGDIPAHIRALARTCLLDTVGVALAGSRSDAAGYARAVCVEGGTQGHCTAFGARKNYSAQAAAFVNGTAAHALDYDDNCYAGFVHGSAVITPAALAVGQACNAGGADVITAFVAGAEAEYAVGAATESKLYDRGWWTTGVLGPIGASMAAARLLGLDAGRTRAALGLAMTGAGGMKACFGSDAKPLLAGRAAEAGVVSAALAAKGASGPAFPMEDGNGFVNLFNDGQFDYSVFDALGQQWFLEQPGVDMKRIPVCLSSHAAVDAVLELVAAHHLQAADIEWIVCDVPPIVIANLKYDAPRTPREAQFSMPFAIAASLLPEGLGLRQLSADTLADARLQALLPRISMVSGASWDDPARRRAAPEGARVSLHMRDGSHFQAARDYPRGSAAEPLDAEQVGQKFLACTAPVVGREGAARLLSGLLAMDSATPVRGLFAGVEFRLAG